MDDDEMSGKIDEIILGSLLVTDWKEIFDHVQF